MRRPADGGRIHFVYAHRTFETSILDTRPSWTHVRPHHILSKVETFCLVSSEEKSLLNKKNILVMKH